MCISVIFILRTHIENPAIIWSTSTIRWEIQPCYCRDVMKMNHIIYLWSRTQLSSLSVSTSLLCSFISSLCFPTVTLCSIFLVCRIKPIFLLLSLRWRVSRSLIPLMCARELCSQNIHILFSSAGICIWEYITEKHCKDSGRKQSS